MRNVDPNNAINSKTPLNKLVGAVTPADLHYERSYAGIPDLDPAKHRLLIHWMVRKPLVLTVNDLEGMCLPSRGSRKGDMSLPPWWFQEPRRCIEVTFLAVARS